MSDLVGITPLDPGPIWPAGRWPAAELTPEARATIAGAINLIEGDGWVQRTEYTPGLGYCATGALRQAATDGPSLALARQALRFRVGVIPIWNDSLPEGDLGKAVVLGELRALLADDGPQS